MTFLEFSTGCKFYFAKKSEIKIAISDFCAKSLSMSGKLSKVPIFP